MKNKAQYSHRVRPRNYICVRFLKMSFIFITAIHPFFFNHADRVLLENSGFISRIVKDVVRW